MAQTRSNHESVPGTAGSGTWAVAWRHEIGTTEPSAWLAKEDQGLTDDGPRQGLPLGGLGTGSIGRDHDGRFARWHLTPGRSRYAAAAGSWIALETGRTGPVALLPGGTPTRPAGLADAMPSQPGTYEALFPVARSRYREGVPADGLEATVTQWSPVLPGEESTSAWPVGYLQVTLASTAAEDQTVTVAMAFELPVDDAVFHHPVATPTVEDRSAPAAGGRATAVARLPEAEASFALAVQSPTPAAHAEVVAGLLSGDGDYERLRGGLWEALAGRPARAATDVANRPGLAAAARVRLAPGETRTVTFALTWDLPRIRFGPQLETAWWRAHTREFGRSGAAAGQIAATALDRHAELAGRVDAWHGSLAAWLASVDAPPWVLAAALNELYVLVEGGTAWVAGPAEGAGPPPGGAADGAAEEHFAVLESVDYKFYETLDVRYYSSFVLLELWPRLERVVIGDFAAFTAHDDPEPVTIEWTGAQSVRTRPGSVPHDLGGPEAAPFRTANHYLLQDANLWKDLNAKLVLQAVRDALLLRDDELARSLWPACRQALRYLEQFDRDGDGIPENDGVPDQTYDTWTMSGVSAYCSDLWLAALTAGAWLAGKAGDDAEAWRLTVLRDRAATKVEQALWRGDCYRFDDSAGPNSEDILADQFAGTWYLRMLGLDVTHPPERIQIGLDTVLRHNLDGFCGGTRGPVNGRNAGGGPVVSDGEQPAEVWVGVAWGLASLCLLEGRDADAWRIGKALHDTVYTDSGLWFRTPEAWTADDRFRAPVYHRPLAVWSLISALRARTRTAAAVLEPAEPLGG